MSQTTSVSLPGVAKASILLLALTSLAGWLVPVWPFELCSHFPLHQAGLLAVLGAFLGLRREGRREWRWLAGALVMAAVHVAMVAPVWVERIPGDGPAASAASGGSTFGVASVNVYFKGERYSDMAAFLLGSKADVVVLVEATPEWANQLAILRTRWPHAVMEPRDGSHGILVFSRFPILGHDIIDLSDGGRVTLKVVVQAQDGPVTIIAFHPPPPTTPHRARRRNVEMEAVAELVRGIEGPRVLVGDFNCTPWSPQFRRLIRDSGLVDSRQGHGVQATWPSPLGRFGIPIDHALVSEDLFVVDRSVGPQLGSDHRAIIVSLKKVSDTFFGRP